MLPDATQRAAGRAPTPLLVFLALMTSVIALTIDAILPALDTISEDLRFSQPSDRQMLILAVFVGMGLGQPIFGPLSDAIGRRPAALIGWVLYAVGTVIAGLAPGFWTMVLARALQGFGAAGPRVVATAIVRDLYAGRPMARILSLIMTVFMLVPIFAPFLGQQIEYVAGWRAIFGLYLALGLVCAIWYVLRVPETLSAEARRPLRAGPLIAAFGEVLRTRRSMFYTAALSAIFAAFATLLAAAQQIFEEILGLGERFPLVFAGLAGAFALAQFTNSRLVMQVGMRAICRWASVMVVLASAVALATGLWLGASMPVWVFMGVMTPVFLGTALLFSNLTALALEPLGHVAGTASAVVMSISTLAAVPIGYLIAREIDTSLTPLFYGFLGLGAVSLLAILAAGRE